MCLALCSVAAGEKSVLLSGAPVFGEFNMNRQDMQNLD